MAFAKENCDSGIHQSSPEIQEALGLSRDTVEGPLWKTLKDLSCHRRKCRCQDR